MNRPNRNIGITNNLARFNNYPVNNQGQSAPKSNNFNRNNLTNINMNNYNQSNDDGISKALMLINSEFKKKDNKIRELELKIQELKSKINSLTNNNNNENTINNNYNNQIMVNNLNNFESEKKNTTKMNNYVFSGQKFGANMGNNNVINNDLLKKKMAFRDNMSHSNDNSAFTNDAQLNSKSDVKNYLKEVKSKIDPNSFREFIKNIKLLTAKSNSGVNRNMIIEKVRGIFGEEHMDLFNRFQDIIGVNH